MKKGLILSMILIIVIFAGYSRIKMDKVNKKNYDLKDGNYLVKLKVNDHGNYPMGKMEINDGDIISLNYVEVLAVTGEEKNKDNFNYPDCINAIEELNRQFNDKKNLLEIDFDSITGATYTKESFTEIVNTLLAKAVECDIYKPVYKDGEYVQKAEEAKDGWLSEVKIVIRDGQIVGIDYFESAVEDTKSNKVIFDSYRPIRSSDGKPKTESVKVKAGDRKSVKNYAYLDSFDTIKEVRKQIIDSNGIEDMDLDGITGATSTRDSIINLVKKALESARK